MLNFILPLLFLIPSNRDSKPEDLSYQLYKNQVIIKTSNDNSITIKIYESEILKVSRYREYLLIYLKSGHLYVYKEGCDDYAVFHTKLDFLEAITNNQIDYLF